MNLKDAEFARTVNYITHRLYEDLTYGEIQDFKQRLIDTQKQLEQALKEYTNEE